MADRELDGHEIARLTREFENSDFYKYVFKPKLIEEMAAALELADKQPELAHSWVRYRRAYEEIITVWLPMWKDMDNEINDS